MLHISIPSAYTFRQFFIQNLSNVKLCESLPDFISHSAKFVCYLLIRADGCCRIIKAYIQTMSNIDRKHGS